MTAEMLLALTAVACAVAPWWVAQMRHERRGQGLGCAGLGEGPGTDVPGPAPEVAVVIELLVAALRTGVGVPRALQAIGTAVGGPGGPDLSAVGTALVLGSSWDQAWQLSPPEYRFLGRALRPAWEHGAPPAAVLEATRARMMRQTQERTEVAAQRLGVHLVIPLGLCFLPSFIALGVVPILFSLGGALLGG